MYIPPDSTIKILKNVPLDPTYDHTIYFTSENNQISFFQGKTKYTLNDQSYQRVQRGYIRCEIQAENLYDCNYVMFRNTAFGDKWFYAFIKSVEYVNNKVSQIEFQIDVMQTWFFNYTLDRCYVEREHSRTDNLYENLVPENVGLGDTYVCNASTTYDMNTMSVCALINKKTSQGTAVSRVINNIYTPSRIVAGVPATDVTSLDAVINNFNPEDIISIYQYPSELGDASTTTPVIRTKHITPNTTIDGLTPHNKKLFSYPYNYLLVSTNTGTKAEYHWEDWKNTNTGDFRIAGVFVSEPSVICYPYEYRGVESAWDDGVVMSDFPQCAWGGDVYKQWLARNSESYAIAKAGAWIATGMNVMGIAAGFAKGKAGDVERSAEGLVNSYLKVEQLNAQVRDIQNSPSQTYGHPQTPSLNTGMNRVDFRFYSMSIKYQFAKIIDDFFDRYGYATKRNKVPNRNVRPHWCYTKTAGCTITGSIPCDDAAKICDIYNNGITFWKNGDEVGHYELDNTI